MDDWEKAIGREVWKPVPSIPGVEASSHGRLRKLPYVATMPHGGSRVFRSQPRFGCFVKSSKNARHIYFNIVYRGMSPIKVHRAVCEAFHGQPEPGQVVIHENENALDNRPQNLRWGTQKENLASAGFKKQLAARNRVRAQKGDWEKERLKHYPGLADFAEFYREVRAKTANDNMR